MGNARASNSNEEYQKVMEVVRDYIFQTHNFPQVTDISKLAGIPKFRCTSICNQLIGQKQLYKVFSGAGLPTIVLPYDMMQEVLRTQAKPKWMANYSFREKKDLDTQIKQLSGKVSEYEQFERLLYMTDIPLEEAVAFALEWLDFQDVKHHKEDTDNPDVTFICEGVKTLVEIEGTTKAGDKKKAQQLEGWLRKEINSGMKASGLKGFFVVNHFRETEPEKRGDPLTPYAKEYLKLYHCHFFTTYFLFNIVKDVMDGSLVKEKAQKNVWEGEKIG